MKSRLPSWLTVRYRYWLAKPVPAFLKHLLTKGLTLEQVDKMFEEVSPRKSAKWRPLETFAQEMGPNKAGHLPEKLIEHIVKEGSAV